MRRERGGKEINCGSENGDHSVYIIKSERQHHSLFYCSLSEDRKALSSSVVGTADLLPVD